MIDPSRPPRQERIGGTLDTLWSWLPDILIALVFVNVGGTIVAAVLGSEEAAKDFLIGAAVAGGLLAAIVAWEEWPL